MISIRFTILGNAADKNGNPTAYMRLVKGHWKDGDEKYIAWGHYVRRQFELTAFVERSDERMDKQQIGKVLGIPATFYEAGSKPDLRKAHTQAIKPIDIRSYKVRLSIMIDWASGAHGDPDNVFKGIADALIVQDKGVAGSFDFRTSPEKKGKVEALLEITDEHI